MFSFIMDYLESEASVSAQESHMRDEPQTSKSPADCVAGPVVELPSGRTARRHLVGQHGRIESLINME
ncbi:hypothetical protein A4R29_30225 (plasmid) [Mesorhizobium ciceri biovar biserrulae]|nr:hypothetical protein A4R29_30225 [Mesorhizobium ciceri biovar biserrulae]